MPHIILQYLNMNIPILLGCFYFHFKIRSKSKTAAKDHHETNKFSPADMVDLVWYLIWTNLNKLIWLKFVFFTFQGHLEFKFQITPTYWDWFARNV